MPHSTRGSRSAASEGGGGGVMDWVVAVLLFSVSRAHKPYTLSINAALESIRLLRGNVGHKLKPSCFFLSIPEKV